jgi:hypothetical protein
VRMETKKGNGTTFDAKENIVSENTVLSIFLSSGLFILWPLSNQQLILEEHVQRRSIRPRK